MPWWRAGTLSTLIWHLNLGNSQVEDAVSSGNIIDVAPLLPPFMDAQDHAVIIQRCPCVAKGKSTRAMANSFVGALPVSPSRLRPSPPPPPPLGFQLRSSLTFVHLCVVRANTRVEAG